MTDFEAFKTESFVSKLLGRGDLQGLVEVMEIFNKKIDMAKFEEDLKKGKFTLRNLQEQFSALLSMGPIDQVLSSIPGIKPEMFGISKGDNNDVNQSFTLVIKSWMTIMDSMSYSELDHHDPLNLFKKEGSRIQRIAKGCGLSSGEISDRIKKMGLMLNTFKKIGPILSQFKGGSGTNNFPDHSQLNRMNTELMKHMHPSMIKQMGGHGGIGEMMKNISKLDPKLLKSGKMPF